eukprot:TRINITY_DN6974_c0_g4_i2.p1 TRINITY_DN6974_c0_g4~~TRINITY_DN6974_c0_g4_i2.p1  ORF type:complete len:407 (+),score=24.13 TRINITY_DN6974_c0_g4_i2:75-1295(+)
MKLGNAKLAESFVKKSQKIIQNFFGDEYKEFAVLMNNVLHEPSEDAKAGRKTRSREMDAIHFHEKNLQMLRKLGHDENPLVADCLTKLGNAYLNARRYKEAIQCFEDSVQIRYRIFHENDLEVAKGLMDLGNARKDFGEYGSALKAYEHALGILKIFYEEKHGLEAEVFINCGICKAELGDLESSLHYYEKALKIYREEDHATSGLSLHQADCLSNIAELHFQLHRYKKSIEEFEIARDIYKKQNNTKIGMHRGGDESFDVVRCLSGIGRSHFALRHIDEGVQLFLEAIELVKRIKQGEKNVESAEIVAKLALCLAEAGETQRAKEYLKKAVEFSESDVVIKSVESFDLYEVWRAIAQVMEKLERKDESVNYYSKCLESVKDVLSKNHVRVTLVDKELKRLTPGKQ